MNYGLYLSAAGALSSMHRQDVLANNLANMNTVGFKPDRVDTRERLPERLESPEVFADPKWMLERLGGGHWVEPTRVSMEQGAVRRTGSDLDFAIEGDGLFVVGGARGSDAMRLTRDGRFTIDTRGELVMATSGLPVMDENGRPIALDPATPVRLDNTGALRQGDSIVARLDVVSVPHLALLRKEGESLFRFDPGVDHASAVAAPTGRVIQGHVESSAVDPVLTMNAMISAAKAAQSNLKMMQYHDQLLAQTFGTFARVS